MDVISWVSTTAASRNRRDIGKLSYSKWDGRDGLSDAEKPSYRFPQIVTLHTAKYVALLIMRECR